MDRSAGFTLKPHQVTDMTYADDQRAAQQALADATRQPAIQGPNERVHSYEFAKAVVVLAMDATQLRS